MYPSIDKQDNSLNLLILGRQKSGKSVLFCNFIKQIGWQFYDRIIIFCPTIKNRNQYRKFSALKNKCKSVDFFFIDKFDIDIVQDIYDSISENTKYKTLLVFDDCISSTKFQSATHKDANVLNTIASAGRHKKLSYCIISQNNRSVSTTIRDNVDMVFILNSPIRLVEGFYMETQYTKKEFIKIFNETMRKDQHAFLCIYQHELYSIEGKIDF